MRYILSMLCMFCKWMLYSWNEGLWVKCISRQQLSTLWNYFTPCLRPLFQYSCYGSTLWCHCENVIFFKEVFFSKQIDFITFCYDVIKIIVISQKKLLKFPQMASSRTHKVSLLQNYGEMMLRFWDRLSKFLDQHVGDLCISTQDQIEE